jgi:hypothetical protein
MVNFNQLTQLMSHHSPDNGNIEMVPETVIFNQLTQFIAQEDFINVINVKYNFFLHTVQKPTLEL